MTPGQPPVIFGFPIDVLELYESIDRVIPIVGDPNSKENDKMYRFDDLREQLLSQCNTIWSTKMKLVHMYVDGKLTFIVSLVKCSRPDDRLIPNGEQLEKLKEVLRPSGFTQEPRWFNVRIEC